MRRYEPENPRYPHRITIVRRELGDRYSAEEPVEHIVYRGPGRSYTDTTTTGDSRLDLNKRKASIPVRFDEWNCLAGKASDSSTPAYPMSGDLVYVDKGGITEEWEVKDFEPDNDRSVIYGQHNRNINV